MKTPPEVPLLTVAYQLAGEYIASGGVSGLPAVHLGGCLRVPRWALIELALTDRVVRLCDAQVADIVDASVAGEASDAR